MAITLNDNVQNNSPKSLDNKYLSSGTGNYASVAAVNAAIPSAYRHLGLTVKIGSNEYWYKDGILDANLVLKTNLISGTYAQVAYFTDSNNTIGSSPKLTVDGTDNVPVGALVHLGAFSTYIRSRFKFVPTISTDADLLITTSTDTTFIELVEITANRSLGLWTGTTGDTTADGFIYIIDVRNTNPSFSWSVTPVLVNNAGVNVSTLINGNLYHIIRSGGQWKIINK